MASSHRHTPAGPSMMPAPPRIAPHVPAPTPVPSIAMGVPANQPSPSASSPRVAITVVYGKRSAKLNVPSTLPVAELLPDIAKKLGVFDPTLVYAGYRLTRDDETAINNPASLADQAIRDGERLKLEVNALGDQDIVYDDVVEAVADSVERSHRPWTSANTTVTTMVVSCVLLGVGAICLALAPLSIINAGVAGITAAALLAIATVLASRHMHRQALALSLVASLLAGVTGYHLMGSLFNPSFYGFPAVGIGAGLLLAGGISCLLLTVNRLYALIPVIIGAALVILGIVCVTMPHWSTRVWIVAVALLGLAANALPWLSLSSARLSVDSPTSESEIFALPKNIDISEVRNKYRIGSTLLFDLRAATSALIVFGTPLAVSSASPAGVALTLVLFAAMLLDSRRIYAQSEMLITVITAGAGICLSCAACTVFHPTWASVVVGLFSLGALLCVIGTQLSKHDSIAMTRLADASNVICVVATLPLVYVALGL